MARWFQKNRYGLLCAAAVALLTVVVFLPAVRNDYLLTWDDDVYVRSNPHIRSIDWGFIKWAFTTFYGANYWHPLTWLSHALDYAMWGVHPAGHHLTNVLLHGLNAALAVLLLSSLLRALDIRRIGAPAWNYFLRERAVLLAATLGGLLFGIHPLRVESVAWIAERKDVLSVFFTLLSILVYAEHVETGTAEQLSGKQRSLSLGYLGSAFFLALALMSKPLAVTVPAIFLMLDWAVFRRPLNFRVVVLEKLPFYLLSLGSALISVYAKYSLHDIVSYDVIPMESRIVTGLYALIFYLGKMLVPLNLLPFYPYPAPSSILSPAYIAPALAAVAVTAACIVLARKQRLWLTLWGYYVITLLPVLPFLLVGEAPVADRFSYLPSLAPFALIGTVGTMAIDRLFAAQRGGRAFRAALLFAIAGIFVGLSVLTIRQIGFQKNDLLLWKHEIDSVSKEDAQRSLNFYLAYCKRGLALAENGKLEEAAKDYEIVLQMRADYAPLHVFTGVLYYRLGRPDDALREFRTAVTLDPRDAEAHRNLGIMYFNRRRSEEAVNEITTALELQPDSVEGHFNIANIYYLQGNADAAIAHYQKALALDPHYYKAMYNLGLVFLRSGRNADAIREFRAALLAVPASPLIHNNLAIAYRSAGLRDDASREYQILRMIAPNFVPTETASSIIMN